MMPIGTAQSKKRRMMIVSLDGFPYSLLTSGIIRSRMPFLCSVLKDGRLVESESVYPAVSCVAWATFLTGRNPAGHGIFGFVDRRLPQFDLILPNAGHIAADPFYRVLSRFEIPVLMMNVPVTYPPEPVLGGLIGDFLGVDVGKIAYPDWISRELSRSGYIIDADVSEENRSDIPGFISHLETVMETRCRMYMNLLERIEWRFGHLHIMETDRLFHFLISAVLNTEAPLHTRVTEFFRRLDECLERLLQHLTPEDELIFLSDHGFCESHHEVQLNSILEETGYLKWTSASGNSLSNLDRKTRLYSLIPGRIYVNLTGREPHGCVRESDLPSLLDDACAVLNRMTLPGSKTPIFQKIYRRDEIFEGSCLARAPDLLAVPVRGIELKGKLGPEKAFRVSRMDGTHTFNDAFAFSRLGRFHRSCPGLTGYFSSILGFFSCSNSAFNPEQALIYR